MLEWPTGSRVGYLTGGTTREPRLVYYSEDRWRRVVETKREMFAAYDIGARDRGAICTPFEPWSIGRVHLEGALLTGASALPLGLTLDQDVTLRMLADFAPTFICGGARYLCRAGQRLKQLGLTPGNPNYLFVAGEKLLPQLRAECSSLWGGRVVDVYGMAEFDLVGYEAPEKEGHFLLTDTLEYAIHTLDGSMAGVQPKMRGELAIRSSREKPWHLTGDVVTVVGSPATSQTTRVIFEHRLEATLVLGEGTTIIEGQVSKLLDLFNLAYGQLQVHRAPRCDRLHLIVPTSTAVDDNEIVAALFENNVDLADSVRCNVAEITVRREPEERLVVTSRGKLPLIVEVTDDSIR